MLIRFESSTVFFNKDPDCPNALRKLDLIQQHHPTKEFVGFCLTDSDNPYRQNPNPGVTLVAVTRANPNVRPTRAPYVAHWWVETRIQQCI